MHANDAADRADERGHARRAGDNLPQSAPLVSCDAANPSTRSLMRNMTCGSAKADKGISARQ